MAAEQALGCPVAELRLLLMLQNPPGCSLPLLEHLALWCMGDVPGRGARCRCWLLAAFPPPPPAGRRKAHTGSRWQGSPGTVRQPQGQCHTPQQLPLAFPGVRASGLSVVFFCGYGLTLPLPRHLLGSPATAVVAMTPLLCQASPPAGLVMAGAKLANLNRAAASDWRVGTWAWC